MYYSLRPALESSGSSNKFDQEEEAKDKAKKKSGNHAAHHARTRHARTCMARAKSLGVRFLGAGCRVHKCEQKDSKRIIIDH